MLLTHVGCVEVGEEGALFLNQVVMPSGPEEGLRIPLVPVFSFKRYAVLTLRFFLLLLVGRLFVHSSVRPSVFFYFFCAFRSRCCFVADEPAYRNGALPRRPGLQGNHHNATILLFCFSIR